MEQPHRDCLTKCRIYLLENVDFEDIRDYLQQVKILDGNRVEVILSKTTKKDKMRELLDTLQYSGPNAFRMFLEALKAADCEYGYVIDRLQRTLRGERLENDDTEKIRFPVQEGQTAFPVSEFSSSSSLASFEEIGSNQSVAASFTTSESYRHPVQHSFSSSAIHTEKQKAPFIHSASSPSVSNAEEHNSSYTVDSCVPLQSDGPCDLSKFKTGAVECDGATSESCFTTDVDPPISQMDSLDIGPPYNFLDELTPEQAQTIPKEILFAALSTQIPAIDILGLNLGFTHVKLQQFKSNNPHSVVSQAIEMLSKWRSEHYYKATVKRLVKAYQKSNFSVECYRQQILDYFNDSDSDTDNDEGYTE